MPRSHGHVNHDDIRNKQSRASRPETRRDSQNCLGSHLRNYLVTWRVSMGKMTFEMNCISLHRFSRSPTKNMPDTGVKMAA